MQLLYLPWHWSGSTGYGRHAVQEATSWAPFLLVCSKYTLDCLSLVDKLSAFRNLFSCTTLFPDWTDLPLTSATALGSLYKSSQHTRYIHDLIYIYEIMKGFPGGSYAKESICNPGDLGSVPGLGRSPGEGKFHGQRNLVGYSPWCCRVRHS